jgi:hypothetical protein
MKDFLGCELGNHLMKVGWEEGTVQGCIQWAWAENKANRCSLLQPTGNKAVGISARCSCDSRAIRQGPDPDKAVVVSMSALHHTYAVSRPQH